MPQNKLLETCMIFAYALSLLFEYCDRVLYSFLGKASVTCGGNTGNKENRCGSCEGLGNIEDDVLSRGSVCNIPNWYVFYFAIF